MENIFGKSIGVILLSGTLLTGNALYSQAVEKAARIKANTDGLRSDVAAKPTASPAAKDMTKKR